MLFSVLLMLLLVVGGTEAGFHGLVLTYTSKRIVGSGPMVVRNVKLSFSACSEADSWICGSGPGPCVHTTEENAGYWCQKSWSLLLTGYTSSTSFWYSRNWVFNKNGVVSWKALVYNELRIRSDIGKPNSTPQTTTIPLVRFPSNCQRNISLLRFDPDGDMVRCRFADNSLGECYNCTPPSVLSLSSSCTLWFSPTSSSNGGDYAVQLMMEDFPRQNITMTDSSNLQELKTTSDFITKIPIQFVFTVLPAIPSCTEGLYLPRFLPPTPEHRAQIYITVKETLQITIRAEATQSQISNFFVSRPYNMVKSTSGPGSYTLTWTPLDSQDNESHPICFLVEASRLRLGSRTCCCMTLHCMLYWSIALGGAVENSDRIEFWICGYKQTNMVTPAEISSWLILRSRHKKDISVIVNGMYDF
nr:uncharacterized protein LOC107373684 [Nothobranchius furzeri]